MITINDSLREMDALANTDRNALMQKDPDELVEMVMWLNRRLLEYVDKMIGPREVAEMFNRRKSWIYDAMARPRTELQRRIGTLAYREGGVLLFRKSDIVLLRNELIGGDNAKY